MKKSTKIIIGVIVGVLFLAALTVGVIAFRQYRHYKKCNLYYSINYEYPASVYLEMNEEVIGYIDNDAGVTIETLHTFANMAVSGLLDDNFDVVEYLNSRLAEQGIDGYIEKTEYGDFVPVWGSSALSYEGSYEIDELDDLESLVESGCMVSLEMILEYQQEYCHAFYAIHVGGDDMYIAIKGTGKDTRSTTSELFTMRDYPETDLMLDPKKDELVYFNDMNNYGPHIFSIYGGRYVFPGKYWNGRYSLTGETMHYLEGYDGIEDVKINGKEIESYTLLDADGDDRYYVCLDSNEVVTVTGRKGTSLVEETVMPTSLFECPGGLLYTANDAKVECEYTDKGYAIVDLNGYLSGLSSDQLKAHYATSGTNIARLMVVDPYGKGYCFGLK